MNKNRKIYSAFQLGSAVFMILALMWLTVSTPFVVSFQQEQAKHKTSKAASAPVSSEEESSKPINSSSEEKAPNTSSLSEEYLHTFHIISHFYEEVSQYHKHENSNTYIAFHGELLVPPPNML